MELLLDIGSKNALLATALAFLAALSGWLCRRPALTHALWLLVLLKLVTPPFWSVAIPFPTGLEPESALIQIPSDKNEEPIDSTSTIPEDVSEAVLENPADSMASTRACLPQEKMQGEGEGSAPDLNNPVNEVGAFFTINWRPVLFSVWLTGALAYFALAGWRLYCFRRLLRFASPAPLELQDQVRCYANQLGLARSPSAWMVPGAVSPMLWAFVGRPRLLLPADLWERMNDNQRATLLVHELAHLRRRDHWVRLLELLAAGLFWWHPVLWVAKHQLRQAEEECCDAWVIWILPQFARDYALALMETVDFLSEVRLALPPAVSGIGHVHFLKRRLAMIMLGTTSKTLSRAGFFALVGLGALVLPLMPTWAQPNPGSQETGDKKLTSERPSQTGDIFAPRSASARNFDFGVTGSYTVAQVTPPKVSSANAPATVEEAQDEIELLQAQLEVKMAEAREGQSRFEQANKRLARLKSLSDKGAISQGEFDKAEDEAALMRAQLEPKQAQINEAKIRLNQARRRLARLTENKNTPKGPATSSSSGTSIGLPGSTGTSSGGGTGATTSSPAKEQLKVMMQTREQLERRVKELEEQLKRSQLKEQQSSELMRKYSVDVKEKAAAAEKLGTELEEKARYADRIAQFERAIAEYHQALTSVQKAQPPGKGADQNKLKSLEAKLDNLAKELDVLRKELKSYHLQTPGIIPEKPKDPSK